MSSTILEILLRIKNESAAGLASASKQFDDFKRGITGAGDASAASAPKFEKAGEGMASAKSELGGLVQGFQGLIATLGGLILLDKLKNIAEGAARTQVLGTVLNEVGRSAGYTRAEINNLDKSVQKMGITAASSRESLTKMLQAGLDVTRAAELARAAQNFAVISGEDSSTTFQKLITNIQQMDTMGLKFMGIVVSMDEVTARYAQTLGKTAAQLSVTEKQTALMNEVLVKGKKQGDIYVMAMGDVGKMVQSLARYEKEYADTVGNKTLPAYMALVTQYTLFLKQAKLAADAYDADGSRAQALAEVVTKVAGAVREFTLFLLRNAEAVTLVVSLLAGFLALRGIAVTVGWFAAQLGIATFSLAGFTTWLLAASAALDRFTAAGIRAGASGVWAGLAAKFTGVALAGAELLASILMMPGGLVLVSGALLAGAGAIGYWVGSWLNGFDAVRKDASIFIAEVGLLWAKFKAFLEDTPTTEADLKIATQLYEDAVKGQTDYINNGLNGSKEMQAAQKKVNDLTQEQIDLQPKIAEAEAAYVEISKKNDEKLTASAKAKMDALKKQDKELTEARAKAAEEVFEASLKGMSEADKAKARIQEAETQRLVKQANAYDALAKEANTAKAALGGSTVTVTEDIERHTKAVTVMSQAYTTASGQVITLRNEFFAIKNAGADTITTVESLQVKLEELASKATTPDDIVNAMKILAETSKTTGINVEAMLQNLEQKRQANGLKEVRDDLEGFNQVIARSKDLLGTLSDVFNLQAKSTMNFKNALEEAGVTSFDQLQYIKAASRDMWGVMKASAELYKSVVTEANESAMASTRLSTTEATASYRREEEQIKATADALRSRNIQRVQSTESMAATFKAIDKETTAFQIANTKKYLEALTALKDGAVAAAKAAADKIRAIDEETFNLGRSHEEKMRLWRQRGMTEDQIATDNNSRIAQLRMEEETARLNGQFDLAKKLNEERQKLVDDKMAATDYADATKRMEVERDINSAYEDRMKIQEATRGEYAKVAAIQETEAKTLTKTINEVVTGMKELASASLTSIKLELGAGQASKIINDIQQVLDGQTFKIAVTASDLNLSWSKSNGYADGTIVKGPGTSTSDSIPAWLSVGEAVTKARAVAYYGVDFMRRINNMELPRGALRLASGGLVGAGTLMGFGGGNAPSDGSGGPRDVVDVNVTLNGRKVTLMGERVQVRTFVTALRNLEGAT